MEIASAVFWIMLGLLYILYKAFREHPNETLAGVLVFVLVSCGIIIFGYLSDWLFSWNALIGSVIGISVPTACLVWIIKTRLKEDEKRRKNFARYSLLCEEAQSIVDKEEYDEQTIREYAEVWRKGYGPDQIVYNRLSKQTRERMYNVYKPKIEDAYRREVRYKEVFNELNNEARTIARAENNTRGCARGRM